MRCICTILVFLLFLNYQEYPSTFSIYLRYLRVWNDPSQCSASKDLVIHFGSVEACIKMPNGSKIKLAKLSILRFVLGTSLFITLIRNTSCSGCHNIPNVHSIDVWCESNFTSLFFNGNSCVVYFRISWLFETNLVRLNPLVFRNCITSTITLIACSNEGNESKQSSM